MALYWPHLHPVFVHFPIAFFVASVGFDSACFLWRRQKWLDKAGVALQALAVAGAGAAAITGKLAEGSLSIESPEVAALVGEHGDRAFFALIVFIAVLLLRFESLWRDKNSPEIRASWPRYLAMAISITGLLLLYETAARGAFLVYHYGVAVH